tara:strand:- start:282 stop:1520 length:1239 start_codon:yes stop_codon:yes gene_type:complete
MKVVSILSEIKKASGSNEKKKILSDNRENPLLKLSLKMALNPFLPFNIVKVPKVKDAERKEGPNESLRWAVFFETAELCAHRKITGNKAVQAMHAAFLNATKEEEVWMRKILKKHLAIGVSTKTANKVFPNLIPTFEVTLAQKFDIKRLKGRTTVGVEPKLDGIRCFTIVDGNSAIMLARSGKPITNFNDTILKEVSKMGDGCYDGELMGEDFISLMRQAYRKEDADTSGTYLALFDFLPIEEWNSKKSVTSCRDRFEIMLDRIDESDINLSLVQPVDRVETVCDYEEIKAEHDAYVKDGFEGAMIKLLDAPYKFGRGYEVMKLKAFHDVDLKVSGLLEGTGKHAGKLGSFKVVFNGVDVQVGSGLTDDLRAQVWKDQDSFVGRTIEVRYQEITPDGSLRFPTFVCFRNDRD